MKTIYIKPLTELVKLNTLKGVLWGEDEELSYDQPDHNDANQGKFFDEDVDDEYDFFFEEESL